MTADRKSDIIIIKILVKDTNISKMRQEISIPLTSGQKIRVRYAREEVSPETYYDHMHDHSLLEVCIFLSGRMLHFSGGHTYRLSRGDIFFARPGELHYALAAEDSVYERFAFWIPEDFFSVFAFENDNTLSVFGDERRGEERVFRLCDGSDGELVSRLERLRESLSGDENMVIFARLCEVISFINKNSDESDSAYQRGDGEIPSVIHNVVRYVRENYHTVTGVDEVADKFYINRDYLTRVFSKYTGMTVHDYIRVIRVNRARAMLSDGYGVTETAYACGFNSTSYFIRVFARSTGVTPAKYRASVSKKSSKDDYILGNQIKSRKS